MFVLRFDFVLVLFGVGVIWVGVVVGARFVFGVRGCSCCCVVGLFCCGVGDVGVGCCFRVGVYVVWFLFGTRFCFGCWEMLLNVFAHL